MVRPFRQDARHGGRGQKAGLLHPTLSPDGRRVALFARFTADTDIWLLDGARTTGSRSVRLDRFPVWSPDGRPSCSADSGTVPAIFIKNPRAGRPHRGTTTESPQDKWPLDLSLDGRFILYHVSIPGQGGTCGCCRWRATGPLRFAELQLRRMRARLSPKVVGWPLISDDSGQYEVYIRPFPARAGGGVSTAGGILPRWAPDGNDCTTSGPTVEMMSASIATKGTSLEPGKPAALFQRERIWRRKSSASSPVRRHSRRPLPDQRHPPTKPARPPITVVQNWAHGNLIESPLFPFPSLSLPPFPNL